MRLDGTEPSKKRPATTSYWTVAERTALKQNLLRHGRDWNRISAMIQSKTAIQAKNYYFNNQKEMSVFVRAWEKEQSKGGKGEADSEATPSTSVSPAPPVKKEESKKSVGPVTIQPAPGQSAPAGQSQKAASGRGNAHYPNVIPQPPLPQQQTWTKNGTQQKPKAPVGAPAPVPIIPTPPLPLPGPTFRAWPVSSAPQHPPHMAYSFGTFPGAGMMKPSPAPGPGPASRPSAPPPNVGVAGPSGTGGVHRSMNHYPGPMRYQPYPVAASSAAGGGAGGIKGKGVPPKSTAPAKPSGPVQGSAPVGMNRVIIPPRTAATASRSSSGQPASWNGDDKGKKPA